MTKLCALILAGVLLFFVARSAHRIDLTYGKASDKLILDVTFINAAQLGPYYLGSRAKNADITIGPQGVPTVWYAGRFHSNPVAVSQYALQVYRHYFDYHDVRSKIIFLHQADWLAAFCQPACYYDFAHPPQIYADHWMSGMAQGHVLSVEARAYELTRKMKYLSAADEAFHALLKPLSHGGPLYKEPDATWFEEYPQTPPTHVLNGHMFALLGLWDYHKIRGDPMAMAFFRAGVATAIEGLAKSDTGYWARYDLAHKGLCARNYLDVEIAEMRVLAKMAPGSGFPAIADRFERYESSPAAFLRIWVHDIRHAGAYERQ